MTPDAWEPRWAPKVPLAWIRRIYVHDAQRIIDDDLMDPVGWGLWERCESILTVTAAPSDQARCPLCGARIAHQNHGAADEQVRCRTCRWQISWATYHQTYRSKQLLGAHVSDLFAAFHQAFPQAQTATARTLLIDPLIHAFQVGFAEMGRPVAANLMKGSRTEVMRFLDSLTHGDTSVTGVTCAQLEWRRMLGAASWSQPFIGKGKIGRLERPRGRPIAWRGKAWHAEPVLSTDAAPHANGPGLTSVCQPSGPLDVDIPGAKRAWPNPRSMPQSSHTPGTLGAEV